MRGANSLWMVDLVLDGLRWFFARCVVGLGGEAQGGGENFFEAPSGARRSTPTAAGWKGLGGVEAPVLRPERGLG